MIVAGFGVIFFGLGNGGHALGLSNLWSHGGFFPNGWMGFFFALSIVLGSYQGVELLGITAGEAEDPRPTIVKAVKDTVGRILIFYVGAIFVIVTIYPWNQAQQYRFAFRFRPSLRSGSPLRPVWSTSWSSRRRYQGPTRVSTQRAEWFTRWLMPPTPKAFTKLNRHGVHSILWFRLASVFC